MSAMKVTPGAAMRARDVSRPRPEHLAAAEAVTARAPHGPQPDQAPGGPQPDKAPRGPQPDQAPRGPQPEGSPFERAPDGRRDAARERREGTRDGDMSGTKRRRPRRKRTP
ncbi:MAG: hypothetical protein JO132_05715 [Streptosporangiaceae bacterium]|nr:hypothetical protein [Streptosporangiaceae bacterium]